MMAMLLPHFDGHIDQGVLLHAMGVLNVNVLGAHFAHGQLLSALAFRNALHGHTTKVART